MTTPTVAARASGTSGSTAQSTHAITLPAGITAGDLLVVIFGANNSTTTITTASSGWTTGTVQNSSANASGVVFWKIAAGGDTLSVSTGTSAQSAHTSYRITGAASTPTITQTKNDSIGTNPDPPAVTPAGGSKDYLYIAAAIVSGAGVVTTNITTAPTGYSNLITG